MTGAERDHTRRILAGFCLAWILIGSAAADLLAAGHPSFILTGVLVADGTGAPLRPASVRVRDGRIAQVGDLKPGLGEQVL